MPGPLPEENSLRRNKPTIPTTALPVSGRPGPVPDPPETYPLGEKGRAWWDWAWTTPQACAWDDGALFITARRAQLEDDKHAIEHIDVDLAELVGEEPSEAAKKLEGLIALLKGLAGGKLSVEREMRQIDDRLGLTPKGLAQLRWKIVADPEPESDEGKGRPGRGRRALKAV